MALPALARETLFAMFVAENSLPRARGERVAGFLGEGRGGEGFFGGCERFSRDGLKK